MERRVIYLVRHGRIALEDEQQRYIGQVDLPLSVEGRRQAEALARRFAHADLGAIICSDLVRSRGTAAIIAAGTSLEPVVRFDLREINMGDWEGLTFREVAARFPEDFQARGEDLGNFRVPGGESFADRGLRAVAAFEELTSTREGNFLIVGHAGANRLILCHLLGMPPANLFRIGQDYGCLNIIQKSRSGYQVRLLNGQARQGRH